MAVQSQSKHGRSLLGPLSAEQARTILHRARTDPAWWFEHVLGAKPWAKQIRILESVRDNARTAVASCHGPGKSWVAARAALWWLNCHPGSIVATSAPSFRQVEKVIWQELRQAHKGARIPLGGKLLQTELQIDDGWFAFGFSTDDSNRFQGLHSRHVLCIFDEAAGVDRGIWTAAEGILTSEHCRLLAIGNPTEAHGPFYEMFRDPSVDGKIHISAFDIPNVQQRRVVVPGLTTYEWVEDKKKRWGEDSPVYQSRVLGRFPTDSDRCVIPLSWVEAAVERWHALHAEGKPLPPLSVVALDVADGGADRSIMARRHGRFVREIQDVTQVDSGSTMALVGHAVGASGGTAARVVVDSIGVGAGVVSRLREQGVDVVAFNAGAGTGLRDASGEMGFTNCRAAAWWGLRERLNPESGDDIALPPDDELVGDLTAPTWKPTSSGKIQVESKDDIRKRLGRSTDRGDAVVMSFWADVAESVDIGFTVAEPSSLAAFGLISDRDSGGDSMAFGAWAGG